MATTTAKPRRPAFLSQATRSTSQAFLDLAHMVKTQPKPDKSFDPKKHLAYIPPSKVYSMSDIKLADSPLSSFAVSEPFRLFSPAAVERMREEIFQPKVLENYRYSSNLAPAQLRGYARKEAPFVYQANKHPEVLAIISKITGVDLIPCTDFEIGHINLSSTNPASPPSSPTGDRVTGELASYLDATLEGESKPIVDWHTDSYPFVLVTMLSSCKDMIGGETMLRMGDGETLKVRGPEQGFSVLLQGRYIEHKALRAFGSQERITSVTSLRPGNPALPEDSVLTTVRPISDLDELYTQYAEYRLEILQKRLTEKLAVIRQAKIVDVNALKAFLKESESFLAHMDDQIVPKELVKKGEIDDSHLHSSPSSVVDSSGSSSIRSDQSSMMHGSQSSQSSIIYSSKSSIISAKE